MPAITREINVLARCGNQFRGQRLSKLSLTAAQAPYILHICAQPGQSQEELAEALHVNPSNAARQLAALCEAGFATREEKQGDRRQLAVYPTDKARGALPIVKSVNAQWHEYLTQDMTEDEKAVLEVLLEKMRRRAARWDSERDGEA